MLHYAFMVQRNFRGNYLLTEFLIKKRQINLNNSGLLNSMRTYLVEAIT